VLPGLRRSRDGPCPEARCARNRARPRARLEGGIVHVVTGKLREAVQLLWKAKKISPVMASGPVQREAGRLFACGFANRAWNGRGMGLQKAGNGQPAPPARRVRVGWCPSRCVPAAASVISPPPRGVGASGTPWSHFEWGMGEIGAQGQCTQCGSYG
jgi:hypothetical protein